MAALLCFVIAVRRGQRGAPLPAAGFGAACGFAMMVKLNAVVLLLLGGMLITHRLITGWSNMPREHLLWIAARDAGLMAGSCILAIAAVFAVHIQISPGDIDPTTAAGQKDARFLSGEYREYVQGARPFSPRVLWSAARDYRQFMAADFSGTPRVDKNASNPLAWPLEHGTINYRWDSDGVHTAYVQLVGNRVSWFLASAAPFAVLGFLMLQWRKPTETSDPVRLALLAMLLMEYLTFMVVHWYLGTQRVMYLYHYFIGLLLTFTMLPLLLQEAMDRWPGLRDWETQSLGALTGLLLISFVFYAPLSFHRPLTRSQCELRNALQHVVDCR